MQQVPLNNTLPNQEFTILLNGKNFDLAIRTVDDISLLTITVDGIKIVDSIKCMPNVPLLYYKYLQSQYGDFIFSTTDNEYPYYTGFSGRYKLFYLTYDEVEVFKQEQLNQ